MLACTDLQKSKASAYGVDFLHITDETVTLIPTVLNPLEMGYIRLMDVVAKRIAVIKVGVNKGTGSCGIEVRAELTIMMITDFKER